MGLFLRGPARVGPVVKTSALLQRSLVGARDRILTVQERSLVAFLGRERQRAVNG